VFISVIVAIKWNEDDYYSNNFYGKVGGITRRELDFLEVLFIKTIRYRLFIDEDLYSKYCKHIIIVSKSAVVE